MSDSDEFVVEGRLAVESLVNATCFEIRSILIEEGRHLDFVQRIRSRDLPLHIADRETLIAEAGYDFHRGVIARAKRQIPSSPTVDILEGMSRLVFPVGLADRGNLGTVVRNAVAFGADAIVLEKGRGADIWSRIAIRASATAVFRVPVYEVEDSTRFIRDARKAGFVSVGTTLAERSRPLREMEPADQTLILLGAEKDGLNSSLQDACDHLVRIPMANEMDSLNVAATAAIVCHELFVGQ